MIRYLKNEMMQEEIKYLISSKDGTVYKILLFDLELSISQVLFQFLKRKHQVIATHKSKSDSNTIKLDISNIGQVRAYIDFYRPNMLIISSETIDRLHKKQKKLLYSLLIDLKQREKVKVIFLNQGSVIENNDSEYVIKGKREYFFEEILDLEEDILFYIPDYYSKKEGMEVIQKKKDCVFVNEIVKGIEILMEEKGRILFVPDVTHHMSKQYKWNDKKKEKIIVFPIKNNITEGMNIIEHQKKCSFNLVYKYDELENYGKTNIADLRFQFGKKLAASILSPIRQRLDYVCPVPKTGIYYGMGLAEELNIPYLQGLIKTNQQVRSFEIQDADTRKELIWSKIKPIRSLIEGKRLAVVDEAIFTGTTLKVVCQMLRTCNVKEIHLCIPTPKCRNHCEYDMLPERPMLLEYINDAMLNDYFDVDSITFQTDTDFISLLKPFGTMCTSCFLGNDLCD